MKRGAADSDDENPSEQDGPQDKLGCGTKQARSLRSQGGEEVPEGQGRKHRSLHPGPIRGSLSYPHDGSAPEEASGP
jgi:hypothetical protein